MHNLERLVCQNRGFTRITRISADFFAVRLSIFVGFTFRLRFTDAQTMVKYENK